MFRGFLLVLLMLHTSGCTWLFMARTGPAHTRGTWRGRIVDVSVENQRTDETRMLAGLQLTEESIPIKRGNQSRRPAPGSVVLLVNKEGQPAKVAPSDQSVSVKGIWTDKWRIISANDTVDARLVDPGVLQVESIKLLEMDQ